MAFKSYLAALLFSSALIAAQQGLAQDPMMPTQLDEVKEWTISAYIESMEIELEITCEDTEKSLFQIVWNDTLGTSLGYNIIDRPIELHCTVRNDTGMLANYHGTSTSQNFVGFTSSDSIVRVHFAPRPSMFSPAKGIRGLTFDQVSKWPEFRPIEVSLKQRGKQKILLEYNPEIVLLAWEKQNAANSNAPADFGPKFQKHIALDRFFLNPEDGKIKTGKKLLKKLGSQKMSSTDLRVVDPHINYRHKTEGSIRGSELIKSGKLKLELIYLEEFFPFEESYPY